jgi:hypothetical protein
MIRTLALAIATSAALAAPIGSAAEAQPRAEAARGVDQLRAGPYMLTVYAGSPPTASNARNSLSRGIRLYEKPHSSTFAAVAAQEIFEMDFKRNGGLAARLNKRDMELISHEIEALVASRYGGFDFAQFEAKEAYTLTLYRQFRGMPRDEILARMRAMRPIAERWLADNNHIIQTLVRYRFPR